MLMEQRAGRVLAVVTDLFFKAKINAAAKAAGVEVVYARSRGQALEVAREISPAVALVDLNDAATDPLGLVTDLKADRRTQAVSLIGFVAHVDTELQAEARRLGCARVLARSAFFRGLGALLKETN
jgi:PleD family two-component response regulator